jgi:hypothetical protein
MGRQPYQEGQQQEEKGWQQQQVAAERHTTARMLKQKRGQSQQGCRQHNDGGNTSNTGISTTAGPSNSRNANTSMKQERRYRWQTIG